MAIMPKFVRRSARSAADLAKHPISAKKRKKARNKRKLKKAERKATKRAEAFQAELDNARLEGEVMVAYATPIVAAVATALTGLAALDALFGDVEIDEQD